VNAQSDALLILFGFYIFLHNGRFSEQTFLLRKKSLRGRDKVSVTSPLLKLMKFQASGKL